MTVMAKVPLVVPPFPSETAYVITGSVPKYPRTGVNVKVPSSFTITVPTFGISTILPAGYVDAVAVPTPAIVNCVMVKEAVADSTSVSFDNKLPARGVFSRVVSVSLTTTGASFTGVTVKLKFAVLVAVPSETV